MRCKGLIADLNFLARNFGIVNCIKIRLTPLIKSKIFRKNYTQLQNKAILDFLREDLKDVIDNLKRNNLESITDEPMVDTAPIWVCWWQGENCMPPLVKFCYETIKKTSNGRTIILITENNYKDFILLNDDILQKFRQRLITVTQLSDIIRVKLLLKYGGFWIDSTYWMMKSLEIKNYRFFTLKQNLPTTHISNNQWSGNFLAVGKNNALMFFLDACFMEYWSKHNALVNYFLIDFLIRLAYIEFPNIKQEIDKVPYIGTNPHNLNYSFNEIFSAKKFNLILQTEPCQKLSWKKQLLEKDQKGNLTMYGYFVKTYLKTNF